MLGLNKIEVKAVMRNTAFRVENVVILFCGRALYSFRYHTPFKEKDNKDIT